MGSTEAPAWIDEYWEEKRRQLDGRRERTRQVEAALNGASRSDLVFGANKNEPNRYRLARITMRAARAFHVSSERMQTTISESLRRIGSAEPNAEETRSIRDAAGPRSRIAGLGWINEVEGIPPKHEHYILVKNSPDAFHG